MPITYSISTDEAVIYEAWTGEVSAKELKEYWTTFLQDARVMAIRKTIVDLRQANIQLTGIELSSLVGSIVIPALQGKEWITAIVVGGSTQYGVSRQYQVFAEFYSRDSIHDDYEKAEDWVRQQLHKSGGAY